MGWRDTLQKAKFRDAEFNVQGTDGQVGRRTVLHEYAKRDEPYAEDMGRKAREFNLEAYVIGADYMAARDRLIAAIEQPGPGTLVHPYRGTFSVVVTACRISETSDEGGMARFSLTFVEAGKNANPAARLDTQAAVVAKAAQARAAAETNFGRVFTVAGQPAFVGDAAGSWVTEALGGMGEAARFIEGMEPDLLSEYALDGQRLAAGLAGLLGAPGDLAARMTSRMAALLSMTDAPESAFRQLAALFGFGQVHRSYSAPVTPTTTARRQQAANEAAVTALTRQAAVITAAEASAGMNFASFDEAAEVRTTLVDALDAEAEAADDATYMALTSLRAAVVADIGSRGADLARVVRVAQPATLPALVVAHRVHGDASREAEIVARNRVRHPGFVPGGLPLEVLSDA